MNYEIAEINDGIAKIVFSDGGWTFVQLNSDMTEADLDDWVYKITPPHLKTGETPSFLQAGTTRTATAKPADADSPMPQWMKDRQDAYGAVESQIEYITENGLEAWQAHVAQIKADNPKTS